MVKTTCFRFNMDKPEQAQAWKYLHEFEKYDIKSANIAVVNAVNAYFVRLEKLNDDPYFENRECEEKFIEKIVSEVGRVFTAEMPKFIVSLMLSLNTVYPVQTPAQSASVNTNNITKNAENEDFSAIDMDFIGG